jgi:PAS domain-containing protein
MLFDRQNRSTRLIGVMLDISERKRLEEDLRRRAEELQKIMDAAPLALFVAHDPDCHEYRQPDGKLAGRSRRRNERVALRAWRSGRPTEVFSRRDRDSRSGTAPSVASRGAEVRDRVGKKLILLL